MKYMVVTPIGTFDAVWDDDDEYSLVQYSGNEEAEMFFRNHLLINHVTRHGGRLVDPDRVHPDDLYDFCQSTELGITVIPDDYSFLIYRILDRQFEEGEEIGVNLDAAQMNSLLDECFHLVERLRVSSDTSRDDLARLKEIISLLEGEEEPEEEESGINMFILKVVDKETGERRRDLEDSPSIKKRFGVDD